MNWKSELIEYRINKARETLEDAEILFNNKRLSSSVNRIYYALFHLITALLLTEGFSSSKHSGVKSLFNSHFIKTKKVDKEIGRFFSNIFDFRQKGDYGDFVNFEEEKVKEWLEKAKMYFDELIKIIKIETD